MGRSEDTIWEISIVQYLQVLFESHVDAIQQIIGVGIWELSRVIETENVALQVKMVLNCFNYISISISLQVFFGLNHINVWDGHGNMINISSGVFSGYWCSYNSLIVGDWPFWGGHDPQVGTSLWVDGRQESILGEHPLGGSIDA